MHVSFDVASLLSLLHNLAALAAHAAVNVSTMGSTGSDLPPGIIG